MLATPLRFQPEEHKDKIYRSSDPLEQPARKPAAPDPARTIIMHINAYGTQLRVPRAYDADGVSCRIGVMVAQQIPILLARVRFPYPAYYGGIWKNTNQLK